MTDATKAKLMRNRGLRIYSEKAGMALDEVVQLLRMEHPMTVMRPGMIHAVADDEVGPWPPEAA